MTVTPSQVAYKAAEIMAERGHCKCMLEDSEGRVCFAGAISVAVTGDASTWNPQVGRAFQPLAFTGMAILLERNWRSEEGPAGPILFNNDPQTTGEDVILLLKEIAERLEETS